jgi:hypothetical protein
MVRWLVRGFGSAFAVCPDSVSRGLVSELGSGSYGAGLLEHRWSFTVPAASHVQLHVLAFRSSTKDERQSAVMIQNRKLAPTAGPPMLISRNNPSSPAT